MQELIDKIQSNPFLLTISIILIVVLIYAVIKRIIKLLIFLFIAAILFLVYVHKTGNSIEDKIERMIK